MGRAYYLGSFMIITVNFAYRHQFIDMVGVVVTGGVTNWCQPIIQQAGSPGYMGVGTDCQVNKKLPVCKLLRLHALGAMPI